MKNLSAYLDEFISEEDGLFEGRKGKCSCEERKSKERKKFKGEDIDKFLKNKKAFKRK